MRHQHRQLRAGDEIQLRDVDYDGNIHRLDSRVLEIVGDVVRADVPSYARNFDFDPNGYVVSAPWTMYGIKWVAMGDEGRTWRRARSHLKLV